MRTKSITDKCTAVLTALAAILPLCSLLRIGASAWQVRARDHLVVDYTDTLNMLPRKYAALNRQSR
jgi:hypothetical protein